MSGVKVGSFNPEGTWGSDSFGLVERSEKRPVNEGGTKGSALRIDTWVEGPSMQDNHLLLSAPESVSSW